MHVLAREEMATMTDNDPAPSTPEEEPARPRQPEPGTSEPAGDPGYLVETGEVAGEDGSVAPIIGGLPAVEGSAWDIGAPLEDRGAGLGHQLGRPPGQSGPGDTGTATDDGQPAS